MVECWVILTADVRGRELCCVPGALPIDRAGEYWETRLVSAEKCDMLTYEAW